MKIVTICTALCSAVTLSTAATAVTITFDDAINGATSYDFDADNDGLTDVRFSTSDPFGFNTAGPGPNQLYINEPGLEGTTLLNPDLRADFLVGATGSVRFGYAVNDFGDIVDAITFSLYDSSDMLLASITADALQGTSSFPEGLIDLAFSGTASYALFDFNNVVGNRYIIDNFTGAFGTAAVPEPAIWAQLIAGFGLVGAVARRRLAARIRAV